MICGADIARSMRPPSHLPFDQFQLELSDCFRRVETLRARLGAVQDGMAAVEPERVLEIVEPFAGGFIARILDPARSLQERSRSEEALAVPPIARAGGRAAGAKNALIKPVELLAVLVALPPFLLRRRRSGLQPRLDRGILRVEIGEVGNQVLYYGLMRQRIDLDRAVFDVVHRLGAGERVLTVDVHRAGAANAFAAGAAEGEGRIDVVLDPDQAIEHHRAAVVDVDVIGVGARILPVVRIPAIDLELARLGGTRRLRPGFASGDPRVFRKCEFNHLSRLYPSLVIAGPDNPSF